MRVFPGLHCLEGPPAYFYCRFFQRIDGSASGRQRSHQIIFQADDVDGLYLPCVDDELERTGKPVFTVPIYYEGRLCKEG